MGRQCDRAAAAMAQVPLTYHQDVLTILPAPLDRSILPDRLVQTDAAVIIKLGRLIEPEESSRTVMSYCFSCFQSASFVASAASRNWLWLWPPDR